MVAGYVIGIIVIVGRIYLFFLSVIEDLHVLLITGLNYSFTLFFSRYSSFSVIDSIYFVTHIILNCHGQWVVYKQNNINTHDLAKKDFYKNTGWNFQSFSFILKRSYLSSLLILYDCIFKYIMKILHSNFF